MSVVPFSYSFSFWRYPGKWCLGIDVYGQGGLVELGVDAGVDGHDWDYGDALREASTTLRFSFVLSRGGWIMLDVR